MDKFDRIYNLHRIFAARRTPIAMKEIGRKLECSPATAYRLVNELRDLLNAPIVRMNGGVMYDRSKHAPAYELPGLWFSAAELQSLLAFQQLLSNLQPGLLDDYLAPFANRIDALLAHRRLNLAAASRRIRVLAAAARPAGDAFRAVASATLQRRRLRFRYRARSTGETTIREVSPQRLVHYRDNWYLDAFDHGKNNLRCFSVDRIDDPQPTAESATDLTEPELDAVLASAYGIFSGEADKTAVLRFSAARARWVADERWHPAQSGQFLEDGRYELRIPYRDARELIMDVLRHVPHVEVVSPEELRREVVERLKSGLEIHGDPCLSIGSASFAGAAA